MAIICISRGTLSGGEAVAERVAERLGCPCLSRERNLATVATRYQITPEVLTATLDKRPSFWEKVLGERDLYLLCVRATLLDQAKSGQLVYHGYLGQFLLPGVSPVLRVRLIAEPALRARAAMEQRQLAEAEALAYLDRVDQKRRDWTRFLFGVDWEDPTLYDIVLNLSRLPVEAAADTVVGLTKQPEFQLDSLQAIEDQALRHRVLAALALDYRTRGADLEVTAQDGTVTIIGTTHWQEVLEAVPLVVRDIAGVQDVRTEITGVKPLHPLNFY
ncbi:MAG TPA: cytidylate kinase family protein [Candidatus Baltobacteraceae bacterium]|nr:cytidylate kinase family protein [Candidatus Baltobacteraceae bacterium]